MVAAPRARRIVLVTAGLMGVGAVAGALCGAAAATVVGAIHGWRSTIVSLGETIAVGAIFGAMVGAIAAPVISWVLLRRVPLGRAIAGTAVGTVAGAAAGELLAPRGPDAILGGFAGFVLAALCLHVAARRKPLAP